MIYAQIGDAIAMYEGMTLEVVNQMLITQNLSFTFISEEVYKQKMTDLEARTA
jgi:hypothetical protein